MFISCLKWLIYGLIFLSVACHTVDDYLLGQDNTPKPKALTPIHSKMKIKETWSFVSAVSKARKLALNKIKPYVEGDRIYTASLSGHVAAIKKEGGQLLWQKSFPEGIVSGPIVNKNLLLLGTHDASILALNPNNGALIWRSGLSADMLALPKTTQDKVIVKTIDGNLYALNRTDGKQLWKYAHGAPDLILKASASPVIVDNQLIIVAFSDGKMDAIDLHTGRLIWQRAMLYASGASDVERLIDIDADPVVEGNRIYLATFQGIVGAYSLTDGHAIWEKKASTYHNLALTSHALYMVDASDVIWALDKNTGRVLWKQNKLQSRGLMEPQILGNYLVLTDKLGYLHLLSRYTGEFLSRHEMDAPIAMSPGISGSNIYVMCMNGKLSAFSVS